MPPEDKDQPVFAPRMKTAFPKFFHHFACQRIFADKSFGSLSPLFSHPLCV